MDLTQSLEIATCTDPGMVRSHNEDSIAADAANGLVVLADGMGGYNAGEVASGMATTVIVTEMRQILSGAKPYQVDTKTKEEIAPKIVREQVLKANTSIYQAAQTQPQYAGMGTTLVVCLFYDNRMLVAHLGDSRLYMTRDGKFKQVTRDHSLLQEQIDSGIITAEQAKKAAHKNLVTKALGGNLKLAAEQLVQMANDNGGRDNVSVILVRVLREYPGTKGMMGKVFGWLK